MANKRYKKPLAKEKSRIVKAAALAGRTTARAVNATKGAVEAVEEIVGRTTGGKRKAPAATRAKGRAPRKAAR